ncbi:MAG: phosphatidylserine decarboxylase [Bacteroidales bacterium]|nr:phosphatidylserine decarboxylase [Bacteroidales bacterium]
MKLDRSSYGAVALVWLIAAVAVAAALLFVRQWWLCTFIVAASFAFAVWQTLFHAVPSRRASGSSTLVSSAADGKVVAVKKVVEREFLCRECIMVSVYMDFWDVHANFWPVSGAVCYAMYHPGRHFLAFKPKASEENEHFCTCIRTPEGREVFFKQLAGGFARRIVCYASEGLQVRAGEQCGIIKFGSRVDIYLPLEAEILVSVGDSLRACESLIARI